MIANHTEREQIRLENVLSALGNPLRLEIIRTLADGSELRARHIIGCDVIEIGLLCHRYYQGRFEDQTDLPRPDIVLGNAPFNTAPGKRLYPELFSSLRARSNSPFRAR